MKRSLVGAVLLGCTLCVSPLTATPSETSSGVEVAPINEQLRGKIATIELADGSTVKKAKRVVVESNFTYWVAQGRDQKVATDEIVRISARSRSKGWVGLGVGAGVGILSIASTTSSSSSEEELVVAANSGAIALSALATMAIGYGIDRAIPRKSRVIYEVDSAVPLARSRSNPDRPTDAASESYSMRMRTPPSCSILNSSSSLPL